MSVTMRTPKGAWGVELVPTGGAPSYVQQNGSIVFREDHAFLLAPSENEHIEGEIVAAFAPGQWRQARLIFIPQASK